MDEFNSHPSKVSSVTHQSLIFNKLRHTCTQILDAFFSFHSTPVFVVELNSKKSSMVSCYSFNLLSDNIDLRILNSLSIEIDVEKHITDSAKRHMCLNSRQ